MNNKTIHTIGEQMEKLSNNNSLTDAYAKATAYRCEWILNWDNPEKDESDKLLINQYIYIIAKQAKETLELIEWIINNTK